MFKFNSDNIFTGHIKQLLASFNLPKVKIYTKEQQDYHEQYVKQNKKDYYENEIKKLIHELTEFNKDVDNIIAKKTAAEADLEYYRKQESSEWDDAIEEAEAIIAECNSLLITVGNEIARINTAIAKLEAENIPELNVLESCFRNNTGTVENKNITNYPKFMRYIPYIKNNEFKIYAPTVIDGKVVYSENDWKACHIEFGKEHLNTHPKNANIYYPRGYAYNLKINNYTRHLQIQNNIYDTYTHEYLGDFLRFQRDYRNIDLMPLYNCFSNNVCPHLNLTLQITKDKLDDNGEIIEVGYKAKFNTEDKNYKIYMIPVKLFKNYTIALDSESAIEMCCGLYGQYQYEKEYNNIALKTYMCFNTMQFKSPVLYTKVNNLTDLTKLLDASELAQHEEDLKLFIKVPVNNKSSIVVLEGNYTQYNDSILITNSAEALDPIIIKKDGYTHYYYNATIPGNKKATNNSVINFEFDGNKLSNKLVTPLQLLKFNTGVSYPFADRLIEYLVGNVVTPVDEIPDNIKRAKVAAIKNTNKRVISLINDEIWEDPLQLIYYTYINNNSKYNKDSINHDILGYVDKDVEKLYSYKVYDDEKPNTIANTNIYEEWED